MMPRYLFETDASVRTGRDQVDTLAHRFPELELEHSYLVHDGGGSREVWVCRAPSEAHLRRWAIAADLMLRHVQRIDADTATEPGRAPT
jgi:hypothetical protein